MSYFILVNLSIKSPLNIFIKSFGGIICFLGDYKNFIKNKKLNIKNFF